MPLRGVHHLIRKDVAMSYCNIGPSHGDIWICLVSMYRYIDVRFYNPPLFKMTSHSYLTIYYRLWTHGTSNLINETFNHPMMFVN